MEEIDAATRRLKQALVERMLGGELTHHLGYPPGGEKPDTALNHPNARSRCRDRAGTFAPMLIPKHADGWPALTRRCWRLGPAVSHHCQELAARHWRETVHQFAILYGDRFLRSQA